MVYRLMVGLGAAGVENVLMMPAGSGLSESLARMLRGQAPTAGVELPALETLELVLRDTGEDTVQATLAMKERVRRDRRSRRRRDLPPRRPPQR